MDYIVRKSIDVNEHEGLDPTLHLNTKHSFYYYTIIALHLMRYDVLWSTEKTILINMTNNHKQKTNSIVYGV